jgi:hypothetical protein
LKISCGNLDAETEVKQSEAMSGFRRENSKLFIAGLLFIVLIEGSSAALCRLLPNALIWHPDLALARDNWNSFVSIVDTEVGGYRVAGAKPNTEFPTGPSCGSAFGDSYVGGTDVANDQGWVEQLSHLLGCRVTNHAVGNYGTDQSYLHFRRVHDDSAFVMLGVNPNTVEDNVNQYDALLGSALVPIALKGRFLINSSGHIEWLPLPSLDAAGFVALNKNPGELLPHSYFLPGTRDGPVRLNFPYTLTLVRAAFLPRLHDMFLGKPTWSALYAADHPSKALQLMTAICVQFVELAKSRGQRPLIVMLPLADSFREKANHGEFEYAPLVLALQKNDVEVFDTGNAMKDLLAGRSACEFFTHPHPSAAWLLSPVPCGGHYSLLANTTLAQLVAAELRQRNFVGK